MEKLHVMRSGDGWDKSAEEIYAAYHASGMKLSVEFESIADKAIDDVGTKDKPLDFKTKLSIGGMRNVEVLKLYDALKDSVEALSKYMRWLKAQDDYPARCLYLLEKEENLNANEVDELQKKVFYLRDATFQSFGLETLSETGTETTDSNVQDVISLLKQQGYEEITQGANKGLYLYEKKGNKLVKKAKGLFHRK